MVPTTTITCSPALRQARLLHRLTDLAQFNWGSISFQAGSRFHRAKGRF